MPPGMSPHGLERLWHADPQTLGDNTLGLFNEHAAVQRALQLFSQYLAMLDGAMLEEPDRGDVRHREGTASVKHGRHLEVPFRT